MNKFKDVLDQLGKDILTDDTKKVIIESYNQAVDALVTERVKIEVENAVTQLDEDHCKKLDHLTKVIDEIHAKKLEQVVEAITKNHTAKLKMVVEKYENMLKDEALKFKDQMVSEVSNYMELYLDKMIPKEQITEAAQNIQAKKTIEKLRKVLAVDDQFVTESISAAMKDGKSTVEDLKKQLNEALKENIHVSQKLKKAESLLILEKKTAGLPDKKRNYVMRLLADKQPQEIESNYEYVVEMFERAEKEEAQVVTEEAKKTTVTSTVETPKSVITETVQDSNTTEDRNPVDEYLQEMTRFDKKK